MKRGNMKKQIILCGLSLISFEAWAQFAVTNNFSSGNVISASQMNTNFNDIEAEINSLWGAGSITATQLATGAVTSSKIQDGSVTALKLDTMGATMNQVLTFNGSNWVPLAPMSNDPSKLPLAGGTMMGQLNMSSNQITNLGTPISSTDAATKNYVDGQITTLNAASIVTGTLSPFRGGTGLSAITANKFVITNVGGSTMSELTCSPGMAVGFNGTSPGCVESGKWTGSANGIEFSTGMNVGIGIGAVNTNKLHIVTNGGTSNGIVLNATAFGTGMLMGLSDQGAPRFVVKQDGKVEATQEFNGTQPTLILKNDYGTPVVGVGTALKFQIGNLGATAHIEGRFESTPSANSTSLSFHTATAGSMSQKMLITPAGTVGIGTTTPSSSHKLVVNGIIAPSITNTHSIGDSSYSFSTIYLQNSPTITSDRRQKKDILESDLGLDFINKLQPVSYRWKTGKDSSAHYGFIAQEVEKVLLEKGKGKHGTSIVSHNIKADKYAISYTELIAPLVKAVKELDNKFMAQNVQPRQPASVGMKNKMRELEAENKAMKAYLCGKDASAPFCKK